jgi:hypothetical protein
MANELADQDEQAVTTLAGLLATGLMAALQGGYLLARTAHNSRSMEIALDLALDHVRS